MSNTPSDAEIRGLAAEGNGVYQDDETAVWKIADPSLIKFTRAFLAKWGAPEPVVREPLTANQVSGLAESAGYWHGDMSRADFINGIRYAEAAHGITQKGAPDFESDCSQ